MEESGTGARRSLHFWRFGGEAPKGFGNFYPKGAGKTGTSSSKTAPAKGKLGGGKKSGGGGSGGGGPGQELGPRVISAMAAAGLLAVWLTQRETASTEINWQEFATVLLESGEVDRIIVTNNRIAEVVLRPGARVSGSQVAQGVHISRRVLL